MKAGSQRRLGGEYVSEPIVSHLAQIRAAVVRVIVVVQKQVLRPRTQRVAPVDRIPQNRGARARHERHIDAIDEDGERILDQAANLFVVLLGCEDEIEEHITRGGQIERELQRRYVCCRDDELVVQAKVGRAGRIGGAGGQRRGVIVRVRPCSRIHVACRQDDS